ncbi:MAG: hypothetical protein ACRELB_11380, partial [Polyangiaceae bacterium]
MRLRFAALLVPVLTALAFASCSNEGEGQPCSQLAGNSGNDDCASGLVCTVVSVEGNRCCPPDRTKAKTQECALSSTTGDGGNPNPPLDASSGDASASDATSADGPATDGAGEAAVEAGAEGGSSGGDASDGATPEA